MCVRACVLLHKQAAPEQEITISERSNFVFKSEKSEK